MQLPAIYKERPIMAWTFTLGAGVIVIWALFSRAFGGGSSSGSDAGALVMAGPSDAQVAAGASLQAATLQNNTALRQMEVAAEARAAELNVERYLADLGFQIQSQGVAATERMHLATEQATSDRYAIASTLESLRSTNERDTAISAINAQLEIERAIQGTAQRQSRNQRDASIWESVFSQAGFGSLRGISMPGLSDVRMKTNVRFSHVDKHGLKWYRYSYLPEAAFHDARVIVGQEYVGVLAHEIAQTKYHAAVSTRGGFQHVDYARLPQ